MDEDEIAIIGAGCRFPGADTLDEFWRVLVNGENHVKDIPKTRWNNDAFYNEDQTIPGKIYVKKAGLLNNHDKWDNRLFGISDVEASRVDPQQRYVLECVHMALEDGGITRNQINGTKTGVIIGCMNDDYKAMANSDLTEVGSYNATGTSTSVISARVSYVYNLHGTCLTLDTACSSALIAIHLASQAIKTGDCDMVICGGVSSILSPDTFTALCQARMMSKIGQCQSFCDTADGYARGEGCGIVILKSLKRAADDDNKIWATIKTGSNQDGSTAKPMTAPSGTQQAELFKYVYETHRFCPSDIQYIETHGTGTPRGDPIEVNALGKFFSSYRNKASDPLLIGSVKSNIGHTESAAGIAGLLKVLLMMKHGTYVPSLHINNDNSNVNPTIKLAEYNLDISKALTVWPYNHDSERYACVNSFGFGGSNTHAIITKKKDTSVSPKSKSESDKVPALICISGVNQESLKLNLSEFSVALDNNQSSFHDISNTSFHHRHIFPYRTLVYGKDVKEIQKECHRRVQSIQEIIPKKKCKKVFVYCGVGTTWSGMCKDLMSQSRTFRAAIERIDHYLMPLTSWKLENKILSDTNYEDPFLNHIAIFCVQVALTEVWKSFGIIPDAIIGQSVGEVAACYAANLLSLEEAVKVIYYRSAILASQSGGSMAVIGNLSIKQVENICSQYGNSVCIAVYSSPVACTISGNAEEIKLITDSLKNDVKESDIFIRELRVQCAYHSPLLQGCMEHIENVIDDVLRKTTSSGPYGQPIPMISTVTGKLVTRDEVKCGHYWAMNVCQPVLFMQSVTQAFDEDCFNIYLELGPRPVLQAHIKNIFPEPDCALTLPSMLPKKDIISLYGSLAEMFQLGVGISLSKPSSPGKITDIPRCIFNRTGDLFIPDSEKDHLLGVLRGSSSGHMFVKSSFSVTGVNFQISIDDQSTPFVYDHFLFENIVIPGATYVEAGFHIGMELKEKPVEKLEVALNFVKTFTPRTGRSHDLDVNIDSINKDNIHFSVLNDGNALATGIVSERTIPERKLVNINYLKATCPKIINKFECYKAMEKINFRYGNSLRLIERCWVSESGKKCLTEICFPESSEKELIRTHFHPAVIDAMFQMFGIMTNELLNTENMFAVPQGVSAVVINRQIESCMYGYAEKVYETDKSTHYNAILLSSNGTVIAEMEDFFTKTISSEKKEQENIYTYEMIWSELNLSSNNVTYVPKRILLLSSNPGESGSVWLKELCRVVQVSPISQDEPTSSIHKDSILLYHVNDFADPCKEQKRQSIFNSTLKRFFDLKELLTKFHDILPIVVITENTQKYPGRKAVNYNGSELWGMLRSAAHEGYNRKTKLIDVDRNNVDIQTLVRVLSDTTDNVNEYIIFRSTVLIPKFRVQQKQVQCKRLLSGLPSDEYAVCSRKQSEIVDPYLLFSKAQTQMTLTDQITLHSITMHTDGLYIQTLGNEHADDRLLKSRGDEDYHIVAIEGRGYQREGNREVIFIHPFNATTSINIPSQHLIYIEDCSKYVSGLLILTHMLVFISSNIEYDKSIIVLVDSEKTDVGQEQFLRIMKTKNCKVQFFTIDMLLKERYLHPDTLLITMILSFEKLNKLVKLFPNLKTIISLNIYFPDQLRLMIKYTSPEIHVVVLHTSEIFSANALREAMPVIKDQLRQLHQNNLSDITNSFMIKLPMNNIQVKEEIQKGSMKCFCDKLNLFRETACYVVVGGLTGLGWELLVLMAEMGAGIIVTLSRRKPSDTISEKIKELHERFPCKIIPIQADIADFESVKNAISFIIQKFPTFPIKGIFHGAGIISDSLLANLVKENVADVMKPKLLGAWYLHLATLNLRLDYFMMHSSIVSVIGNPGQCSYAAANSFLDSFALYRRSIGLPAQSINWGALSVGMAVQNNEIKIQLQRSGFNILERDQIRGLFLEAMLNDSTNVVYADIEWDRLLSIPSFSMQTSKFSEFKTDKSHVAPLIKQFSLDDLSELDKTEQTVRIRSTLREIICEVFVTDQSVMDDDTPLTDIGIDSMAAMSLSNSIDDTFNCRIPITTLLSETSTLSVIVENVVDNLGSSKTKTITREESFEDNSILHTLFDSKDFTFMQLDLLESYKNNRSDRSYLTVIDVELTAIQFSHSEWETILNHVLMLHVELRKMYFFTNDGGMTVETISNINQIVNIRKLTNLMSDDKPGEDIRMTISSDIHRSLPVSFIIVEKEDDTLLRIIAHKVAVDMKGLSLLCRDISSTGVALYHKKELPPKRPVIDVGTLIKQAILPRMKELDAYWENYLNVPVHPITLGPNFQKVKDSYCITSHIDVPKGTVEAIKKYIAKLGISMYAFMMSLYQLYLYIGSESSIIAVGTAADMRFHVPQLNHVLTRCANHIPIVSKINKLSTITHFIKQNSDELSTTTLNSAFPSSLILKKLKSADVQENIFRHFLVMNDMTEIRSTTSEENDSRAKVLRVWQATHSRETSVFVRYDLKQDWIKLELTYNSDICGKYGASMADKLLRLANEAMVHGDKTVATVRDELYIGSDEKRGNMTTPNEYIDETKSNSICLSKSLNNTPKCKRSNTLSSKIISNNATEMKQLNNGDCGKDCNTRNGCPPGSGIHVNDVQRYSQHIKSKETLIIGQFDKQTNYGWDHTVHASLSMVDGQQFVLEWGKSKNIKKGTNRVLNMKNISTFALRKINGIPSLVINTKGKTLILKTTNKLQADEWMAVMERCLFRLKTK